MEQFFKEIEVDFQYDWQWAYSHFRVLSHDDVIKVLPFQLFRIIFIPSC